MTTETEAAPAGSWTLGPAEVAEQVGVSRDTIRVWADTGKLPCWRTPSGYRRFRQSDIDALLARA